MEGKGKKTNDRKGGEKKEDKLSKGNVERRKRKVKDGKMKKHGVEKR